MNQPLLSVHNLSLSYRTREGEIRAVDSVSFSLGRGEALGLVGESGSGKSSLAMALMKLLPENAHLHGGEILLNGVDLVPMSENQVRPYRWNRISMIFQSAMNSLDPVYKVGEQIAEAMELHQGISRSQANERIENLFAQVGLDIGFANRYPHEYSGGMKQRAIIAMALACDPDVIIADEPTTALDVIMQDRILRQMRDIQKQNDMAMIYITHDIGVLAEVTDYVGVMYAGRLVELGRTSDLFRNPMHPYTKALMSSFPTVSGQKLDLMEIEGESPDMLNLPTGCRFHPRCAYATDECFTIQPDRVEHSGHTAECWNPVGVPVHVPAQTTG